MIDRETVLHVAALARLEVPEEEVEETARRLSSVLTHIETMGELDLADVTPTTHVVEPEGGLRADHPRDSLPREVVLAEAPDASDDGFRVPSPQA